MRVALIGYYDTGNLGDEIQRQVTQNALECSGHEVKVYTIGDSLNNTPFIESPESILQLNEECDAVVFGGCLLIQIHQGLVWSNIHLLEKPYYILCSGSEFEGEPTKEYKDFIDRASAVFWRHSCAYREDCVAADLAYALPHQEVELCSDDTIVISAGMLNSNFEELIQVAKKFDRVIYFATDYNAMRRGTCDLNIWQRLVDKIDGLELVAPRSIPSAIKVMQQAGSILTSRRYPALIAALSGIRPVIYPGNPRIQDVHDTFWGPEMPETADEMLLALATAQDHPIEFMELEPIRNRVQLTIGKCIQMMEYIHAHR